MNDATPLPAPLLREVPRFGATTRSVAQQRPIVLVLGMHRSGTSLCSHVLSALGVDMADKVAGPGSQTLTSDNARGHWERWEIVDFHDRIFGLFNQGYYSPLHDFGLPVAWWADPHVVKTRREMVTFVEQRMGPGLFGFKDPRSVRLMPLWHQITKELKLTPKIIYCLRNPAQVARSLHARDRLSLDLGEYRWFSYNMDFFRYTKGAEICAIEYESWFDDHRINLNKLKTFLGLTKDQPEFDLDLTVSEIVDNALRHDDLRLAEASQPLIRTVYKLARQADHDTAARNQIQDIAVQSVTFQQLQRALRQEFEQTLAAANRIPALDQKVVALEVSISEREARLAAASAQGRESAAEVDRQKAEIADLLRQRATDEARLAELEAALAERQAMQAEMAKAQERSLVGIRGQVADLENVVKQVEQEAQERIAAIKAIGSEITEMNKDLRAARRRAESAEIRAANLSDVAHAAMQALAMSNFGTVVREPPLGWRQGIRRLFGIHR